MARRSSVLPGAQKPPEPDDFALADFKTHVVSAPLRLSPSTFKRPPLASAYRPHAPLGLCNAKHEMHNAGRVDFAHRGSPDGLAVAHDRHAFADREYLVEEMSDVDDDDAFSLEAPR